MARAARESGPKVLAVASGGGHWLQLMRVSAAFEGCDVVYVAMHRDYQQEVPESRLHVVRDANRWDRFGLVVMAWQMLWIVIRERPDVVFSTGAAMGLFALAFGRLLGARTIWLDSLANVEQLSMSGRLVAPFAQLRLTQWEKLGGSGGVEYAGSVL